MNVLPVLDAVLARLREKLPQLQVEYFPEKPAEWAINVLDAVRRILGGHTPPGCRRRIWLTREVFIGEVRGLWQYALDFATESVFIEDSDLPSGPLLTEVNYEESE
ncbi:Gp37 family protein [Escherichia coli]|nr:Gp37 family protein [Escherichia coli]MCL9903490.1 Gp37 family protein [Escherichia coli]